MGNASTSPTFGIFVLFAWLIKTQTRKYDGPAVDELIERFKAVRQETIRIVREIKEDDLDREGVHASHGKGKLDRFIRWVYEHARKHDDDARKVLRITAEPKVHVEKNGGPA
jgi:hypothetical protein